MTMTGYIRISFFRALNGYSPGDYAFLSPDDARIFVEDFKVARYSDGELRDGNRCPERISRMSKK